MEDAGNFDVVFHGQHGEITALENLSQKSLIGSARITDGIRMVVCCFSGDWIEQEIAVGLVLFIPNSDETQTLYAKKEELAKRMHHDVPLHPDLIDL